MKKKLQLKEVVVLGVQAKNNYCIYVHINKINNKVYVGQTNQKPQYRWGKNGNGYKHQDFYKAILKYGWNNFEHKILETGLTLAEANIKEQEYIQKFDSYLNGYNETIGGKNRQLSQNEKNNISIFMKTKQQGGTNSNAKAIRCLNTKQLFNTIKEAADWCNGIPENISQAAKRKGSSAMHPETKEALYWCLEKNYNKNIQLQFEENKNKLISSRRAGSTIKQVAQIDVVTDQVINIFNSCVDASINLFGNKDKHKGISRCALGDRKTAYGYKWRYL